MCIKPLLNYRLAHPVLDFTRATGLLPIIEALGGEVSPYINHKCILTPYTMCIHLLYYYVLTPSYTIMCINPPPIL
jgi:hypothetical protein